MMYHYTYLIQHNNEDKRYIGVRSSKVPPTEDSNYWGSSKYLPDDVKDNHTKIILKEHKTRKQAVAHEIILHELNDVARNNTYYNRAKQTSTGFDTSGVPISADHKKKCSDKLKGRVFSEEHRKRISENTKGKKKSDKHVENCKIAQKKLAQSEGYVNPRQGVNLTDETKRKISETKKARGLQKSVNNNNFKPWFITKDNVTTMYYDKTKEELSIEHKCLTAKTYQDLSTKSKGYLPIKRGVHKGIIIGNIEDAINNLSKPNKPLQKRAWYITYPGKYSIPFYYTTRKEYAEENGIKAQAVNDAIHLSSGTKEIKRGHFKGLVLGRIT